VLAELQTGTQKKIKTNLHDLCLLNCRPARRKNHVRPAFLRLYDRNLNCIYGQKETDTPNIGYAQLLAFEYIWYADFLISICLGRQILLRKSANASIAARWA